MTPHQTTISLTFFFAANNHKNEPENKPETEIKNKKKEE